MSEELTAELGGYVLAGGRSSRMGTDKAFLRLAGRPLIAHAVRKLSCLCREVHISGSAAELEAYAPVVRDLHPGCGPIGGIEAALAHSPFRWNLFLAVDMPFLPLVFLRDWVGDVLMQRDARVAMFTADGAPQPTLCLLHQDVLPYVRRAIAGANFKLFPILRTAGWDLAARQGASPERVFVNSLFEERPQIREEDGSDEANGTVPGETEQVARARWFANVNTPEEFAEAACCVGEPGT